MVGVGAAVEGAARAGTVVVVVGPGSLAPAHPAVARASTTAAASSLVMAAP